MVNFGPGLCIMYFKLFSDFFSPPEMVGFRNFGQLGTKNIFPSFDRGPLPIYSLVIWHYYFGVIFLCWRGVIHDFILHIKTGFGKI